MAVVAVTNIYAGRSIYVPGEIIEGLTEKEEKRLVALKCAKPYPSNEKTPKQRSEHRG